MDINAVIIDNDKQAVAKLRKHLYKAAPGVKIIGIADSAEEAYKLIMEKKPDIVFIDIELNNSSAFELLEKFQTRFFKIIFVTKYSEYAIKAIRFNAIGYILKPVNTDVLRDSINNAIHLIDKEKNSFRPNHLYEISKNNSTGLTPKIAFKTHQDIIIAEISNIIRFQAENSYTHIYFTNSKTLMVSQLICYYEKMLEGHGFYRVHKSHLLNASHLISFHKASGILTLDNGDMIPVSVRKRKCLSNLFKTQL